MKIKEAIRYLECLKLTFKEGNSEIDCIIELLQNGEVNEKIIDKINKDYYGAYITFGKGTMMELTEFLMGIEQEVIMDNELD